MWDIDKEQSLNDNIYIWSHYNSLKKSRSVSRRSTAIFSYISKQVVPLVHFTDPRNVFFIINFGLLKAVIVRFPYLPMIGYLLMRDSE